MNRRDFIKIGAMAGAATLVPWRTAYAFWAQTPGLSKFTQRLRLFGLDIPALAPDPTRPYPGVDYYTVTMKNFWDQLHPDLPPTQLLGYTGAPGGPTRHLEGTIIARKGTPVRVRWINSLPDAYPLPVDLSLLQPYGVPAGLASKRAAPHLHGGLVPWTSDGGPFHWFGPGMPKARVVGPSVIDWLPDTAGTLTDDYWYPNVQSARMMWYHDHAVGITRTNAYAGLASGYLLKDDAETILMRQLGLPDWPERQIALVIQDKIFTPGGQLWYPNTYDTDVFGPLLPPSNGQPALNLPVDSTGPEFWGDTMLVNGTVFPYMEVEARRYRFQILNACNTRALRLRLVYGSGPNGSEPASYEPPPPADVSMLQIGTEGGFLDGNAVPQGVLTPLVILGGAERADVIIDFTGMAGSNLLLFNDAPVPFPNGNPLGDFYPGSPGVAIQPAPGFGPNTRTLMQFRVKAATSPDLPVTPGWRLPPSPAPVVPPGRTRDLALWEMVDEYGRLTQQLGTLVAPATQLDAPTEIVRPGIPEVWRIFNPTADMHPLHFHFFNVRVLSRQAFDPVTLLPIGPVLAADPNEQGWKETVRFNPGEVTTVLVDVPDIPAPPGVKLPESPRLRASYNIANGSEYVWHCHILEHEEHDMMRPLVVLPTVVARFDPKGTFPAGTFPDSSGFAHNGTIVGGVSFANDGDRAVVAQFDGTGMVRVPDAPKLDLTRAMTLAAWVKPFALNGWRCVVLKERPTTGLVYGLYAHSDVAGPSAYIRANGFDHNATRSAALPLDGRWHHVATTYNGRLLILYVDGVEATRFAVTGSIATSGSPLFIGGNAFWGEFFAGLMDDIRIYDIALTREQIQYLVASTTMIGQGAGVWVASAGKPSERAAL